jgi:hypothetical protein
MWRRVVGVIMVLVGGLWFLQGIGVAKGSFMTGEGMWTAIGAVTFVVGLALILSTRRRRTPTEP